MTSDKVPQVKIWHTLAERKQKAAKTDDSFKRLVHLPLPHSNIYRLKTFEDFFFFNDTLCFFPFWQQNIVTNTNPPPFTVFFREQHKYQIHPTRAYCEEKQDVIVTEAKALMCPPSEIP